MKNDFDKVYHRTDKIRKKIHVLSELVKARTRKMRANVFIIAFIIFHIPFRPTSHLRAPVFYQPHLKHLLMLNAVPKMGMKRVRNTYKS